MNTGADACLTCGSDNTEFEPNYGFSRCFTCGYTWERDEDDPDYDEADNLVLAPDYFGCE